MALRLFKTQIFSLCHSLSYRMAMVFMVYGGVIAGTVNPAIAQQKAVPERYVDVQISYAPLVKKTTPAVVNIYAEKLVVDQFSPFGGDPFFEQFFGNAFPKQHRERLEKSLGSGVIIRPNGLIVTNYHVIEQAQDIRVMLWDRREFLAKVVFTDERTDLAIIQLENISEILPYLQLANSESLEVGDLVMAIGNPFGVGQTVTTGVVSALARTGIGVSDFRSFIQTDAAINPGNSGGALVNMQGELVGINTAILSRSGGSQGLGYAVPSDMVKVVINAGVTGKKLVRGWLGLVGQDITYDIAQTLGLNRTMGVLVEDMHPLSPFRKAGIETGDVILWAGGRRVDDFEVLRFVVGSKSVGDIANVEIFQDSETSKPVVRTVATLNVEVFRDGKILQYEVPLVAAPEIPPANVWEVDGKNPKIGRNSPFMGLVVRNINPAFADENYINPLKQGVMVVGIQSGSVAQQIGFQMGDIFNAINDQKITDVKTLQSVLKKSKGLWKLALERGDQIIRVTIE